MITYIKGDLLDSNCDYICHQVNCQGIMGGGIAKQIREKWPEVYEQYLEFYNRWQDPDNQLGEIDIVELNESRRRVINMYAQDSYGRDGYRYTSYDAFACALESIRQSTTYNDSIGFPKNIGCGLGGGNWKVISALIEDILGDCRDVYIYEL